MKTDWRGLNKYQTDHDLLWFYLNMVERRKNAMTWSHLHDMRQHYNFIYSASIQAPLLPCRNPHDSLIPPIFTEKHIAPHVCGFCETVNLPDLTATGHEWLFNKMAHGVKCVYSSAGFPRQVYWAWGAYCMAPAFPISDNLWLVNDVVSFRQRSIPSIPSIWSKFSGVWTEIE
jgi:hypothetical protein